MNRNIPQLVAHRGYPQCYPENTLEGIRAALQAGACFVEFDVQLSADGVPLVIHDASLLRTAGVDISVLDHSVAELQRHKVGESARLGAAYAEAKLPELREVMTLFAEWPRACAVIEIKRRSLQRFGQAAMLSAIDAVLKPLQTPYMVISFDYDFILHCRQHSDYQLGWVASNYDRQSRELAEALAPDYLIIDMDKIPSDTRELVAGRVAMDALLHQRSATGTCTGRTRRDAG